MNYIILNETEYRALREQGKCPILRASEQTLYTARLAEPQEQKSIPGSSFRLVGYATGEGLQEIAVIVAEH